MPILPVLSILAVVGGLLAAVGGTNPPSNAADARFERVSSASASDAPIVLAASAEPAGERAQSNGDTVKAAAVSPEQRKAFEQIIKEYLMANPEILADVQQAYETKQEATRNEQMKQALASNSATLFRTPNSPTIGNLKGDVTIVEFFDYNCGYCKRAFSEVSKMVESDKRVKLVFKELPIFGKDSEGAARVAIAAKNQNKYWDVHKGLMESKGKADEARALEIAAKSGANMEQLKKDMISEDTKKQIEDVRGLAEKMGIQGTPHFFVADKMIGGAPDNLLELLTKNVSEVRQAGGCKVC